LRLAAAVLVMADMVYPAGLLAILQDMNVLPFRWGRAAADALAPHVSEASISV